MTSRGSWHLGTVVAAEEDDPTDENYGVLRENIKPLLKATTDQDGRRLRIVSLPMPEPVFFDGHRLPASYANFYIANGLVLVPTFNDPKDRRALSILVFPVSRTGRSWVFTPWIWCGALGPCIA